MVVVKGKRGGGGRMEGTSGSKGTSQGNGNYAVGFSLHPHSPNDASDHPLHPNYLSTSLHPQHLSREPLHLRRFGLEEEERKEKRTVTGIKLIARLIYCFFSLCLTRWYIASLVPLPYSTPWMNEGFEGTERSRKQGRKDGRKGIGRTKKTDGRNESD